MTSLKEIYASDLLSEASFGPKDIPEFFFVSVKFANFDQLANKKLTGVQGITSSITTASTFAYTSPLMLKMEGVETVSINNLTMVNYTNPDYLVSKNFKAINRIKSSTELSLFNDIIIQFYRDYTQTNRGELSEKEMYRRIRDLSQSWLKNHSKYKINSVNDFVLFISQNLPPELLTLPFKYIKNITLAIIQQQASAFKHEKEWIVKDKILNVPDGTIMLVKTTSSHFNKNEFFRNVQNYGLDKIYQITLY